MAQSLELHTPLPPTQCVPTTLSWADGEAPYTLKITTATGGSALQTFSGITDKSFQWAVNLPGGTLFDIVLSDSTPITVQVGPILVLGGSDSSCLNSSSITSTSLGSTSAATASSTSSSSLATEPIATSQPSASGTSSFPSTTSEESSSSTGSPRPVSATPGDSLSKAAIAGIAVGATLAGILVLALLYRLWQSRYARRMRGARDLDLNESSLPPAQPPRISKALEMREHLLSQASPGSSPDATSFAQYPSGISGGYPEYGYSLSQTSPPLTPTGAQGSPSVFVSHAESVSNGARPTSGVPSTRPSSMAARNSLKPGEMPSRSTSAKASASGTGRRGLRVVSGISVAESVQESDAGVRLAGGPPPEEDEFEQEVRREEVGGTIPPPYRRYEA